MPATEQDLKIANRHLVMTGTSLILTIIFWICLYQIIFELNKVYSDTSYVEDFINISKRDMYNNPWGMTLHIIPGSGFFSAGEREVVWLRVAFLTGVVGYILNFGILITASLGLSVKKSGISWTLYLLSMIGAAIALSAFLNVSTWYILSFGFMLLSFAMTFQTKIEIKSSIREHEKMMADAREAFDRENQARMAGDPADNTVTSFASDEVGGVATEASVGSARAEPESQDEHAKADSDADAENSGNRVDKPQGVQTAEEPVMENSTSQDKE